MFIFPTCPVMKLSLLACPISKTSLSPPLSFLNIKLRLEVESNLTVSIFPKFCRIPCV